MISGLISLFGGTAFRWLMGEALSLFKAHQDHRQELEMVRLNMDMERQRSELRKSEIQAAADAGVKVVQAQAEAAHQATMDQAWLSAVEGIDKPSGIGWIDGFNKFIRPELAQVSILLLAGHAIWPDVVRLEGVVLEVVCGVLGLFIGGRIQVTGR